MPRPTAFELRGTRKGIHRGSVAWHILEELERAPERWFRWFQFPSIHPETHHTTIRQAFGRLIRLELVEHRVIEGVTHTGRRGDVRYYKITEIRHKEG